ncbi:Golgi-associated plant pathogenesis-related protein 1 isoform 3-T4 [Alca torda]
MLLSFLQQRSQATEEVALKLPTLRPRHSAAKLSEERRHQVKLKKKKKTKPKKPNHPTPLDHGKIRYAEELATTRVLKHSSESANGKCGENLAWASYDQPGLNILLRKSSYMPFCSAKHFYISDVAGSFKVPE